jgi:hypothetical protein
MAGNGNPAPRQPRNPAQRPMPPARPTGSAPAPLRKPPQVLMIKKEEEALSMNLFRSAFQMHLTQVSSPWLILLFLFVA